MKFAKLAPLASCLFSFLAGVMYAEGVARAPARDAGVVIGRQTGGVATIDLAADGVRVEPIGIAYVGPDGRGREVVLCRDGRLVRYVPGAPPLLMRTAP